MAIFAIRMITGTKPTEEKAKLLGEEGERHGDIISVLDEGLYLKLYFLPLEISRINDFPLLMLIKLNIDLLQLEDS